MHVPHATVKKAFWNWFHARTDTYGSAVRSFYDITGITSFLSSRHDVTEEQARRIEMMAGPHGETVVRMLTVRETPCA